MPSIEIQVLQGVFTDAEKAQIITRVTDAFGSVAGDTIRAGTSVRIHEIESCAHRGHPVMDSDNIRSLVPI